MKWDKRKKPSEQDLNRDELLALADHLYERCAEGWSIVSSVDLAIGSGVISRDDFNNIKSDRTKGRL